MVHTLFLTDSQKFDSTKISWYMVLTKEEYTVRNESVGHMVAVTTSLSMMQLMMTHAPYTVHPNHCSLGSFSNCIV